MMPHSEPHRGGCEVHLGHLHYTHAHALLYQHTHVKSMCCANMHTSHHSFHEFSPATCRPVELLPASSGTVCVCVSIQKDRDTYHTATVLKVKTKL